MLVTRDRAMDVVASSNEASRLMEVFQLDSRSGPAIQAVATGGAVFVNDADELRRRWPSFGRAVEDVGFSAVYALPMRLREDSIGALSLFNGVHEPLSEFDLRLAQALADVATIGILQQRSLSRRSELTEQLQLALNTRISVEQAKGVLAEYGGVDMDAAFEALRSYARSRRAKLSLVAQAVVRRQLHPREVIQPRPAR